MYENYSAEKLAQMWRDKRDVQNVMGKYASSFLLKRERGIYDMLWCRETAGAALGHNDGWYLGEEDIRAFFAAADAKTEAASKLMQQLFPKLEGLPQEKLHGVGESTVYPIVSGIVEIAEDGKTAKGSWLVLGADTAIGTAGPVTRWQFGTMAADFVRESDGWRIWHLVHVVDLDSPGGRDWTKPDAEFEPLEEFAAMADVVMPEPTVKTCLHEAWHPGRPFSPMLPYPEPYVSFEQTFSYGPKEV